jgi:16S rRNA U1498 N3-methylase RsmE
MHPAEENGVVRKTQTSSSPQNEPHSLHWAKAHAILPGSDTERGQTGPERCLKQAERREAYEANLQPEVVGVTLRALLTKTQNHQLYAQPGVDMIQSVEADPPPAEEEIMALTQKELRHLNGLRLTSGKRSCVVKGSNKPVRTTT